MIGEQSYFSLAGVAQALRWSPAKRFEVNWSYDQQAYVISSGKRQYAGRIGEEGGTQGVPINRRAIVNGKEGIWNGYRIDGVDYFDANDLARALDMNLQWIPQTATMYVDVAKHFEGPAATPAIVTSSISSFKAVPTASTVLVDGTSKAFDAYNIEGNNYFKLRDLAYVLSGTAKQFGVGWDGAKNAISLMSGQPYTAVGGEMASKGKGNKTPTPTAAKVFLDGEALTFSAYNIDGNNYFKLRDIAQAFDFGVTWDGAANKIAVDTDKMYVPE
jgi:prophage antirepressor-like protein